MRPKRWHPLVLLQCFLGAALLLLGVVSVVAGLGLLFDPTATMPAHGGRTNDPWTKAVFPAVGLLMTIAGSFLYLGYPRLRVRQKIPPPPANGGQG